MAMSGVETDPAVISLFNEMKIRSVHKYAVFKIEKKKTIQVDFVADAVATDDREEDKKCFQELVGKLAKEPRYLLYDFGFTSREGRKLNKLAFIFWCPEDSKVGEKMIYASSKDAIKKAFAGLSLEFQANDRGDLDYNNLADEVERKA